MLKTRNEKLDDKLRDWEVKGEGSMTENRDEGKCFEKSKSSVEIKCSLEIIKIRI